MDIAELSARIEIADALARYVRGMDRLDLGLALSAFHSDAVDHHGRNVGNPVEIFPLIMQRLRGHVADSHLIGSTAVEFVSDARARVETVAIGVHRLAADDSGPLRDLQVGLRYVDLFERRQDAWLIAERHVVEDWRRTDPVGEVRPGAFELGRRDRDDRSYRLGV